MTRPYRIGLAVILVIIVVPALIVGGILFLSRSYKKGFDKITFGLSKQNVSELMGEPSKIEACNGPSYSYGEVIGYCAAEYRYYLFIETWGIILDKDGKVIGKYYHVLG